MVPKGWIYSTLEGLIDIKHGFAFKSEHFTNQGKFVLLTPGHFNESGGFRDQQDKTKYYNGVIPDGYLLTRGDLLLAMTEQAAGLLGSAAHIPEDNKYLHNQRLGLVKVLNPDKIDPHFLFWLYNSSEVRKQIAEQASGTKVKHTSPGKLIAISVLIPPVAEQKKIAKILSTWDKAIATTERLLANSQQQKQALMQQLLTGQKRFAGFSDVWETRKLREISTRVQRKTDGEEHPILTISSLSGFVTQEDKYSRYMAGESVNNYILLKEGEFAYNKGNSKTFQYGCIFKLSTFATGLVPHVYVCFRLHQGFDQGYYAQLFAADYLKDQLAGLVNTGVRNNGLLNIKPSAFLDTTVPVPPLAEQQKIAQVLSTTDAEIANLQAQLDKLKLEKKALMQQLLTGKRRVRLDDEEEDVTPIRRVG